MRRFRALRWRLSRSAADTADAAAAGLPLPCGPAAYFSMFARLDRFAPADLDKLVFRDRSLRPYPLHRAGLALVPFEALPALFALQRFAWGSEVRRSKVARRKNEEFERASAGLRPRLDSGPLRADAVAPAERRALDWLAARGEVAVGLDPPNLFGEPVYEVPSARDRVPPASTATFAFLEDCAKLYFAAAGPATRDDFLWWGGLSRSAARHTIEDLAGLLEEIDLEGERKAHFMIEEDAAGLRLFRPPGAQRAALIPSTDPAGAGSRARFAGIVEPRLRPQLEPGGRSSPRRLALLGGTAVGQWEGPDREGRLSLTLAKELSGDGETVVQDAVTRLEGFIQDSLAGCDGAPALGAAWSRLL